MRPATPYGSFTTKLNWLRATGLITRPTTSRPISA
jgi:hypothetical protein